MMGEKLGIVDVGGGYRGVYASGVLDYCMDHGLCFDLGIGVSAGSANLISYAARQRGRNHQFYTEYGLRKEYAILRDKSRLSLSASSFIFVLQSMPYRSAVYCSSSRTFMF